MKIEDRMQKIQEAIIHLRGNPYFGVFMEQVQALQREHVIDNCMDDVMKDHRIMVFNSGVIYTCERLLQFAGLNVD